MRRIPWLLAVFALAPLFAHAANAWNERDLSWGPRTACYDGTTDLTVCPITGYKLEVAGSCSATTWNLLATVGDVTTYHVANLKSGTYCFRVRAINTNPATHIDVDSDPSSFGPASQTIVTPPVVRSGAPGPVSVAQ